MQDQNLYFNILTFDWPTKKINFYFGLEEIGHCQKIDKSIFPRDIEDIFPNIKTAGTECIYTTFAGEREGFRQLEIDLPNENPHFAKRYYDRQINYYFRAIKKRIIKVGFIKENQVWLPIIPKPEEVARSLESPFTFYEKYSLKVQIGSVSKFPEIQLSYDGRSRVLKKSLSAVITEVSPKNFKWMMHKDQLYKYDTLGENGIDDYDKVYPVVNFDLFNALKFPFPKNTKRKKDNKYISYLASITNFKDIYLNTPEFIDIIPLNNGSFLGVNPATISRTNTESNQLLFGNQNLNVSPYYGLKEGGPYGKTPFTKIHFFFIFHKDDLNATQRFHKYLAREFSWFKGITRFVKILFHTEAGFSIMFENKNDPLPEIDNVLSDRTFDADLKYFAFYITPHSKDISEPGKKEIYYKVKEALLKRNISSQVIDPKKMDAAGKDYVYSLVNICVATLAKLNGIPWRLHTSVKNELIVGVGAFKHIDSGVEYIGSAFSFNNNGSFNRFEYFMKHELDILAGSISNQIREYATVNNAPERLIIHFYKTMSDEELQPILNALQNLGLSIPVFIITINKTLSEDLVAFDESLVGLMPQSGTFISVGNNKYLLFNNTRYTEEVIKATEGWHFPIKLKIDCTDKKQLKEVRVINDLIEQVYQFSRMYWKSVSHQNLPVTIKYPEMVAKIAPHFEDNDIHFGKDNLWFL